MSEMTLQGAAVYSQELSRVRSHTARRFSDEPFEVFPCCRSYSRPAGGAWCRPTVRPCGLEDHVFD